MTKFEFVFGLISIITSLALTHLVVGITSFARRARARFSLRHALWVWTAFTLVLANWASFWGRRAIDWDTQSIFISLMEMIGLYAFAALVIPELDDRETIDLVAFHESQGKRYIAAQILFCVLVVVGFAVQAHTPVEWLQSSSFAWLALLLSIVAFIARPIWLQQAMAVAIAALGTYFVVLQAHGLDG